MLAPGTGTTAAVTTAGGLPGAGCGSTIRLSCTAFSCAAAAPAASCKSVTLAVPAVSAQAALAPTVCANIPAGGADSDRSSAVAGAAPVSPAAAVALWKLNDCRSAAGACCVSVLVRLSAELEGRMPPPLVVAVLLSLNLLVAGGAQLLREGAIGRCQGQVLHHTPQGGPLAELLPSTAALVKTSAAPAGETTPLAGCLGKSPCVPALGAC